MSSIAERTSVDTDSLLLMGAEARNLLHAARGHTFRLRSTTDLDLGKAFLLGVDIGSVLSAENRVDLLHLWAGVDAGLLVRSFTFGRDDLWTRDLGRRGALLDQIARGIAGGIVTGRGASRP